MGNSKATGASGQAARGRLLNGRRVSYFSRIKAEKLSDRRRMFAERIVLRACRSERGFV
jgi:hypothetical protein